MRGAQKESLKGAQCSLGKSIQNQEDGIYNINLLLIQNQGIGDYLVLGMSKMIYMVMIYGASLVKKLPHDGTRLHSIYVINDGHND